MIVCVNAQAVDGKATEQALVALAKALGVKRRDVELVLGATTRDKVVEIQDPKSEIAELIGQLLKGQ